MPQTPRPRPSLRRRPNRPALPPGTQIPAQRRGFLARQPHRLQRLAAPAPLGRHNRNPAGARSREAVIDGDKWRPKPVTATSTSATPRILIASHSHPEVSNGGAEIAAFQLFRAIQAQPNCKAWFLGCDRSAAAEKLGATLTQPYSDDEFIYATNTFDWFKFANQDPRFPREIERLFTKLAPNIVHFHHYANFGVETFLHLKRTLPDCKIVLTLHEYLAICHNFGQMVTKDHLNLCYQSSPARCNKCFPEIPRSDFFLRNLYITRFFNLVDSFIAPSRFLADRYIAWGIPAEKIHVVENLMPEAATTTPTPPPPPPLRLGFFGQISALKGIDVLFDTATLLEKNHLDDVSFEIYGDYRNQPPDFQSAFLLRLAKAGPNIRFHGPYDRHRVDRLMQSVHAILVPSIWWENSPVVIQEALRNHRPIICSDIGGMAEKVRDGMDGLHFPAGNPVALAGLIRKILANPALLPQISTPPATPAIQNYLAIYQELGNQLVSFVS
jgi:glycosyltransferase involved in cell wall biosynthesis